MMKIAALLSGGVDSSVVVHLLCEQGYKPTLFYIKIGMDGAEYMDCSAEEDIEMSTAIARKYGLSLEVVDLHKEYWENVAAYAIDKIKKGLTPNPDVMCNKLIKFGCFEQQVGKNFDFTATGHYATTIRQDGKTWLGTAKDPVKDQTDFLAQIDYLQVSKLMFPIGGLMKQMGSVPKEEKADFGKKVNELKNWASEHFDELNTKLKEKEMEPEDIRFSPEHLSRLITLVDGKVINSSVAKEVFQVMFEEDVDPEQYVEEKGLKTVNDEGALRKVVEEVIAANSQSVEDYHNGKEKAIGFLVGQTMKAMKGKADPASVNQMLKELL